MQRLARARRAVQRRAAPRARSCPLHARAPFAVPKTPPRARGRSLFATPSVITYRGERAALRPFAPFAAAARERERDSPAAARGARARTRFAPGNPPLRYRLHLGCPCRAEAARPGRRAACAQGAPADAVGAPARLGSLKPLRRPARPPRPRRAPPSQARTLSPSLPSTAPPVDP
ncbi:MAG: hypothetical protein J3K34DRAFT_262151 [Monoraphidium minutum]|nr:MAG: hypothetical protein J3K34DRAFT_262151 [Monoraphidium minutum]